ncbi:hypothetical protein NEFER03_0130 [Nematocida sp. LUAm3]|nr:hypothetical protein NEFER03_0130 [Nematocida sp. LUAm3]KAI5173583.1 hypothetical protein NEFER02_0099 [Nematocida sp. LUAm2]KAI5176804.1 hypothetical protein NEFER01_0129 [Nematocida sp. LUAm1]
MEKEFLLENYGVIESQNKEVCEEVSGAGKAPCTSWISDTEYIYLNGSILYKRHVEKKEEKRFCRVGGEVSGFIHKNDVIAAYTREGVVRIIDGAGNRLSLIEADTLPIRAASFLGEDMLCVGGESSTLKVFRLSEKQMLLKRSFSDYIESISCSDKYIGVSLSNGDIYIYRYTVSKEIVRGSENIERSSLEIEEVSLINAEKASSLFFLSSNELFIGLSSGLSYIYLVDKQSVVYEAAIHSKSISSVSLHGEFLLTASLDGRVRISTKKLKEVTSLCVGDSVFWCSSRSPTNGTGSKYLISTISGDIVLYKENWNIEKITEKLQKRKNKVKTLAEISLSTSTNINSSQKIDLPQKRKKNNYEGLLVSFHYRKALLLSISSKSRPITIQIIDYLSSINKLISTISTLSDEDISYVLEICIDLLKEKKMFYAAHSVLLFVSDLLSSRESPQSSSLYGPMDRAIEELNEEYTVQCTIHSTSEFIKAHIFT